MLETKDSLVVCIIDARLNGTGSIRNARQRPRQPRMGIIPTVTGYMHMRVGKCLYAHHTSYSTDDRPVK